MPLPAISDLAPRSGSSAVRAPVAVCRGDARQRVEPSGVPTGNQQRYSWPGVVGLEQRRLLVAALVLGVRAARRELAAGRRVDRGRADDRRWPASRVWLGWLELAGSSFSSASVYGICMSREQRRRSAPVSTTWPGVHHGDLVGAAGDDAEVVGDEDHRHVALALLLLRAGRGSGPAR